MYDLQLHTRSEAINKQAVYSTIPAVRQGTTTGYILP